MPALARLESPEVRYVEVTPAPPRRQVSALVRRGAARRPALEALLDALQHRAARLA
jgi:DNA-binding transcriptional LysR family regulator